MAIHGYIQINASEQGEIIGSSTHLLHEGQIEVLSFEHLIEVPKTDIGLSAGKPVHNALRINKLIDKSSPKLQQAMWSREVLTEVIISWYQPNKLGEAELFYEIKLENALVSKIQAWTPHLYETEQDKYRLMEDVFFSYEKIIWSTGADREVEYEVQAVGSQA